MQDPFEDENGMKFYYRFREFFIAELVLIGGLDSVMSGNRPFQPDSIESILLFLVTVPPLAALASALAIIVTRCEIYPTGLLLTTALGLHHFVLWENIEEVSFVKWSPYLYLRYYRLRDRNAGKTVYYPKSLARQPDFDRLVLELSPADCPIRLAATNARIS